MWWPVARSYSLPMTTFQSGFFEQPQSSMTIKYVYVGTYFNNVYSCRPRGHRIIV